MYFTGNRNFKIPPTPHCPPPPSLLTHTHTHTNKQTSSLTRTYHKYRTTYPHNCDTLTPPHAKPRTIPIASRFNDSVWVTGSHTVFDRNDGRWRHVEDSHSAARSTRRAEILYNLVTENHTAVVNGTTFSDWEEGIFILTRQYFVSVPWRTRWASTRTDNLSWVPSLSYMYMHVFTFPCTCSLSLSLFSDQMNPMCMFLCTVARTRDDTHHLRTTTLSCPYACVCSEINCRILTHSCSHHPNMTSWAWPPLHISAISGSCPRRRG